MICALQFIPAGACKRTPLRYEVSPEEAEMMKEVADAEELASSSVLMRIFGLGRSSQYRQQAEERKLKSEQTKHENKRQAGEWHTVMRVGLGEVGARGTSTDTNNLQKRFKEFKANATGAGHRRRWTTRDRDTHISHDIYELDRS